MRVKEAHFDLFLLFSVLILGFSALTLAFEGVSLIKVQETKSLNNRISSSNQHIIKSLSQYKLLTMAEMVAEPREADRIDGKAIAATIRQEIAAGVTELTGTGAPAPGLAVVLVGERRDSATYVRMKKKACEEVGITSYGFDFPADVTQEELVTKVQELNNDPAVNGILVQLPLPSHIDERVVLDTISQEKDVDGLHPLNVAALCQGRTHAGQAMSWDFDKIDFHIACTPQGCIELLDRSGVEIKGARAVVLGRSNIVGIPVAMLLMHRNATVTIVHSRTVDIPSVVKQADIVVAAVGRAQMVKGDWLKPGAVVIDVGINSIDDASKKSGYRLVGDVDFEEAKMVASKITPVPGGVGPMTIAMLLRNTLNGAKRLAASGEAKTEG